MTIIYHLNNYQQKISINNESYRFLSTSVP